MSTVDDLLNPAAATQGTSTVDSLFTPPGTEQAPPGGGIRQIAKQGKWNPIGAAKDIGKLLYDIPVQTMGAIGHARERGEDPNAVVNSADKWIAAADERTAQRAAELTPEQRNERVLPFTDFLTRGDIADTSGSTGFTLGSMGASVAAAAPLMLVPEPTMATKVAGVAAGMTAAGTFAYKADKNMFTRSLLSATEKARAAEGLPSMTDAERAEFLAKTDSVRSNHALWEAGPEAVGNALAMTGVGKIFSGVAGKAVGKVLKGIVTNLGGELSTETVTQMGQQRAEAEVGATNEAPRQWTSPGDWKKSLGEVAPQVTILTGLTGGAGAAAGGIRYAASQERKDAGQQKLLSSLIKGAKVSVANSVATVTEEGKPPVTMPVKALAEHFAAGGTMGTLTPEQRYGDRAPGFRQPEDFAGPQGIGQDDAQGMFDWRQATEESLRYNQERNAFPAAPGMVRDATGRLQPVQDDYGVQTPSVAPNIDASIRQAAAGRGMTTTLSPQTRQMLADTANAREDVTRRNQTGIRHRTPGETPSPSAAELRASAAPTGMQGVDAAPQTLEEAAYAIGSSEPAGAATWRGEVIAAQESLATNAGQLPTTRTGSALASQQAERTQAQSIAEGVALERERLANREAELRAAARGEMTPAQFEQEVLFQNRERNRTGVPHRTPGEVPGQQQPPPITKNDGKPFATEKAARTVAKKMGLVPEQTEVRPVSGGFVIIQRGGQNAEAVRRNEGQVPQGGAAANGGQAQGGSNIQQQGQERAGAGVAVGGEAQEISNSVDKSSDTQYSTSEGSYNSTNFKYRDMGEDTSEEGKKSAATIRQILLRAKPGTKNVGQISTRKASGAILSTVDKIEKVFGRRVVFFASDDLSASLPNGFIDKNDPKTIYVNTTSGFSPTTIIGHELLHAMRREKSDLYELLYSAALDKNLKLGAFDAFRAKLKEQGWVPEEKLTRDYVVEEMLADFLGDEFSRPEFWEALAQQKPSLFRQVANFVKSFLDDLIADFKRLGAKQKNFQSDQFFNDIQTMRNVVVDALAQYGGAKATPKVAGEDVRFSAAEAARLAKAFYSKLQQVASDKFQGMKAQSVLPFLQKQGVKKEEIEATGVKEWLAGKKPTDKVTQQELSDFVQANTVELEDVVLGETTSPYTSFRAELVDRGDIKYWDIFAIRKNGEEARLVKLDVADYPTEADALEAAKSYNAPRQEGDTHFAQYQEPGAEEGSYREMFVTAPTGNYVSEDWKMEQFNRLHDKYKVWAEFKADGTIGRFVNNNDETVENVPQGARKEFQRVADTQTGNWQDGHSQYSDIKNPVVRIRFNSRTDSHGRKVLFIEEMQGPSKDNQQKMPAYLRDNLYNLGVKRILAYAKENGFAGISWTTGEMQVSRYEESVRKHIGKIIYAKHGDGYRIIAFDPGGVEVKRDLLQPEEIEKHYGKEISKKVLEGGGKPTSIVGNKEISGLDLKVGGEGLKSLYDKTLPRMFEAYAKGKVGEVTFGKTDEVTKNEIAQQIFKLDYDQLFPGQKEDVERHFAKRGADVAGKLSTPFIPLNNAPDSFPLFSTADGALKLGKEKVTEAAQAIANPKSRLHELYVQYAPNWLSVTPLITLVQTFGKNIQQVKDFARHMDGVVSTKNDIVNTAKELYDEAMELAQAGPGEKAFNYAAGIATFYRMNPWLPLMEQDWVPKTGTPEERLKLANVAWKQAKMDVATGLKFHEAHKEAVKAYEALGDDKVKQAYRDIVEDLQQVRNREKNTLLKNIEQSVEAMWNGFGLNTDTGMSFYNALKNEEKVLATLQDPEQQRRFAKVKQTHAQLMAKFDNSFSEIQGAYWPVSRVGDYILRFPDTDGVEVVKHYVTAKLRRIDKQRLIEEGVPEGSFNEDYKDKRTKNETAIPQELMDQLAGAVEAEYLKDVDMNDADAVAAAREAAQDIVSNMNQIWLRWQPETAALKNSLRRKNVRGFSEDMMRSYLDYMSRHASNIAWTEQGRKIEQDIKSLADEIRKDQRTPGANTDMKRHILNDLRARVQAIKDARVGPIASGLGKLGTAYYMTSPSIALVQMSQLGVITLPKLMAMRRRDGSFVGWSRATKALAAGTKAAFTKEFTKKAIFTTEGVGEVFDNIRAVVTDELRKEAEKPENKELAKQIEGKALGDLLYTKEEILKQIEKLSPYQQQLLALREATARNLLDISAAHEAYELTQGKDPNGAMSKAFRYAMLPMQLSELASRKAAVLSTFDLANQDKKNFFEAMNDVSAVVNGTLYSYAKEHKGYALQGGNPRVLLQFMHYRIMTGIRLVQLFLTSIKGESPEVKEAARKEFLGIMGMAGALGGSVGLPMASVVFAIMNAMLGDDDEPVDSELMWRNWLKENFGETLGNVMTTGLPYLVGTDVSKRVGMGDIFGMQQAPPPGTHGKNLFAWWALSQLGPVASVGQSWAQGYDEFSKGNYLKSLEVSTPKPIRDALKAYRVATEGLKTSAGKKILADEAIGADEVMLMALGFNPDEVAKAQAAERSLNRMSTMVSERRGALIKQAAKAILEGDTSEAMQEVINYNKKMPLFGIKGGDIKSAVRKMITGELGVTGPRDRSVAGQWEIPSYL